MHRIFDEAIGASPPTRVDVDAIVTRRQRVAVLRSGAAGAIAAAVVAVVAVAGLPRGPGTTDRDIGGAVPTSAMPPPAAVPGRDPETPEQTRQRLAAALTDRLTAALPGVRIDDRVTKRAGVAAHALGPGAQSGIRTSLRLTTAAGSGSLDTLSERRDPAGQRPPTSCEQYWAGATVTPSDRQCRVSVGAQGQHLLTAVEKLDDQAVRYSVVVLWADTYVDVRLTNYFQGWEGEGDPPERTFLPAPQLTMEELTALAASPDLAV